MASNSSFSSKKTKNMSESSDFDQVVPQQQKKCAKKKVVVNVDECVGTIHKSIESVFKYTTNENFRQKTMNILKVDSPSLVSEAVSFHLNQLTETYYNNNKVDVHSEKEKTDDTVLQSQIETHCVPNLTRNDDDDDDDFFEQLAFNDDELY